MIVKWNELYVLRFINSYNANMQYLVGHVATFLTIPADEVFDDLRKCIGKAIEHCSILADVKRDLKRFNNNFK